MNTIRTLVIGLLFMGLACSVEAKDKSGGWRLAGTFTAGGDGKEVAVAGVVPVCRIRCTGGAVIINSIVVREGGKKTSITVGTKIEAGNEVELKLVPGAGVTGLRIGDAGRGTYEVLVPTPAAEPQVVAAKPPAPVIAPAPAPVVVPLPAPVAPAGWKVIANLTTAGKAVEVAYQGPVAMLRIECLQGNVVINTVVVRHGGKTVPITVAAPIKPGSFVDLPVVGRAPVTGFRISDSGKGSYRLLVR